MSSMKSTLLDKGHSHGNDEAYDTGDCCGHGSVHNHGHSHGHTSAQNHGHGHIQANSHGHSHGPIDMNGMMWKNSLDWLRTHDPSECTTSRHEANDCEQARCDHSQLNSTTNVIVMVRANELIAMSRVNSVLAITAVLYIAVNVVCTVLNSYNNGCDPSAPGCSPATTPAVFHHLEFWSTFVFNTVDVFALSYSPKNLSNQYGNPTLLKLIVLFNVGMSFCSCLLISINLEKFEVPAHELEYANELVMVVFDATILLNLVRGRSHQAVRRNGLNTLSIMGLLMISCVAIAQLGIYNLSGWTGDGDSKGERASHYLEFAFGIASAGITFWFTMDNKMSADQRLRQIMYDPKQSPDLMTPVTPSY